MHRQLGDDKISGEADKAKPSKKCGWCRNKTETQSVTLTWQRHHHKCVGLFFSVDVRQELIGKLSFVCCLATELSQAFWRLPNTPCRQMNDLQGKKGVRAYMVSYKHWHVHIELRNRVSSQCRNIQHGDKVCNKCVPVPVGKPGRQLKRLDVSARHPQIPAQRRPHTSSATVSMEYLIFFCFSAAYVTITQGPKASRLYLIIAAGSSH